jgi:hypothetical protein
VVAVFTYEADPAGRTAEQIADETFDIFNEHPRDPDGADLACAYHGRRLRSLSFPGKQACCGWSCCAASACVLPRGGVSFPRCAAVAARLLGCVRIDGTAGSSAGRAAVLIKGCPYPR